MASGPDYPDLAGLTVFVIEDETLLLVNLEDMLADLGCVIVGPASRLEQAEKLLDAACAAEAAILDVNIGGRPVFPIAERLAAANVPIIFTTGYGREGLPPEWQGQIVISKPYAFEDVAAALRQARAR